MIIPTRTKGENARSYALRVLLFNITNLELVPGTQISENELAGQLGLSRTPCREALIELQQMQLTQIYPQRGSFISLIDLNSVDEASFARLELEKAVVRLCCNNMTPLILQRLKNNLEEFKLALAEHDVTQEMTLDTKFHRLLFESQNKLRTFETLHRCTVQFDRLRTLTLSTLPEKGHDTIEDHAALVAAIEEGNPDKAAALMILHLTRHNTERQELIERYPQYFKRD